jgi:rhomboid protease GluP
MTSLFPEEARQPQPAFNLDDVPAAVRLNFGQLLDWFTPNIFVCWIILAVNIAVFAAMLFAGFNPDHASPQLLLKWGADYGPATITHGQWWRVVTCGFVHLGILHVAFNMFVLAQIGPFMERPLGNIGFLIVYLTCVVAGAMCSLWWNPYLISAGASGAIFGLYGALIGFLVLRHDSIPRPVLAKLLRSAALFLIYNAVFGVLKSGTDLAAHAGGLVGGLICGLVVSNPISAGFVRRRAVRCAAAGLGFAALLFCQGALLPKPMDFQGELLKFAAVETRILASYKAILLDAKRSRDTEVADKLEAQVMQPLERGTPVAGKLNRAAEPATTCGVCAVDLHGCAPTGLDFYGARP